MSLRMHWLWIKILFLPFKVISFYWRSGISQVWNSQQCVVKCECAIVPICLFAQLTRLPANVLNVTIHCSTNPNALKCWINVCKSKPIEFAARRIFVDKHQNAFISNSILFKWNIETIQQLYHQCLCDLWVWVYGMHTKSSILE